MLQNTYLKSNRDIPEWLQSKGSEYALVLAPENESQTQDMIAYAGLLAKAYIKVRK